MECESIWGPTVKIWEVIYSAVLKGTLNSLNALFQLNNQQFDSYEELNISLRHANFNFREEKLQSRLRNRQLLTVWFEIRFEYTVSVTFA